MTLNQQIIDLVHKPNDWYSPTVEYVGKAYVRFSNPKGWIRGNAICKYDEIGNGNIELEVEEWENEEATIENLKIDELGNEEISSEIKRRYLYTWLSIGHRPHLDGEWVIFTETTNANVCNYFELKTQDGIYVSEELTYFSEPIQSKFTFHPQKANFQVIGRTKDEANYWVLPLLNFITFFLNRYSNFNNHHLRILPVRPEVFEFLKSDAPENEKHYVHHNALAHSYLISFMYNNESGFIEPVPNYREYEKELVSEKLRNAQTAVMVGSARNLKSEIDPVDLLPVLGIATGHSVGAAWFELRDEGSALISRFHANFGGADYGYGRVAIDERIKKGGIGKLLTQAGQSPHYGKSQVRALMRNLERALSGHDAATMLFYVCAGLDVLYSYLIPNALTAPLSSTSKKEVEKILDEARIEILRIANKLTWETKEEKKEAEALKIIANKLRSDPLNKHVDFGAKVIALLSFFGFEDQIVTEKYFHSLGLDSSNWKEMLDHYRNRTMHYAYYPEKIFFISSTKSEEEIGIVLLHLYDILLRCVLRLLEYDGDYYVSTSSLVPQPVDWVKSDTPPSFLGYK